MNSPSIKTKLWDYSAFMVAECLILSGASLSMKKMQQFNKSLKQQTNVLHMDFTQQWKHVIYGDCNVLIPPVIT